MRIVQPHGQTIRTGLRSAQVGGVSSHVDDAHVAEGVVRAVLASNGWKITTKGRTPRGSGPSGKKIQKSCQKYLKDTCTDPSYTTKEDCSYDKCASLHAKKSHQPSKKSQKDGKTGKGSNTVVRNVQKLGCVSRGIVSLPESQVGSIMKKDKLIWRSCFRLRYSPAAERSIKIREKKRSITQSSSALESSSAQFHPFQIRGSLQ